MLHAKDIMTEEVITVKPETSVEDAAKILSKHGISGLPVVDDQDSLVGIVTEKDLIIKDKKLHFPDYINILGGIIYIESHQKFVEEFKKYIAVKVEELMTKRVLTIVPETPIDEIADLMTEKEINRLPVIDKDKLVGIVTRADIVKHISGS